MAPAGAFAYCTGLDGTGDGAYMRLVPGHTPTARVKVLLGENQSETAAMFEAKKSLETTLNELDLLWANISHNPKCETLLTSRKRFRQVWEQILLIVFPETFSHFI